MEGKIGILITGAREWVDKELIEQVLASIPKAHPGTKPEDFVFIHGNCQGVDILGAQTAKKFGWAIESYPADWAKYGRAAGPIRNKQMCERVNEFAVKYVYGFHDAIAKSKGTLNCINYAKSLGLNPRIISH